MVIIIAKELLPGKGVGPTEPMFGVDCILSDIERLLIDRLSCPNGPMLLAISEKTKQRKINKVMTHSSGNYTPLEVNREEVTWMVKDST